jgi:alginate O-acetyltransferase complex protein AlgI
VVFFLCGLWHGASWTFVAWGLFHGLFLVLERLKLMNWMTRVWSPLRHAYLLLVVMIGWVLFRSETFSQALAYLAAMFGFGRGNSALVPPALLLDQVTLIAIGLGIVCSLPVRRWLAGKSWPEPSGLFAAVRLAVLAGLFLLCAMQLAAGTYNPFIYFRF